MYEQASGQLSFTEFEVENFIGSFGITDAASARAVEDYLTSKTIMYHRSLDRTGVTFTPEGVLLIEESLAEPKKEHGPLPSVSLVTGDVGPGAQIQVGSGSFTQSQNNALTVESLRAIVTMVQAATLEWTETQRAQVFGVQAAIEGELTALKPDKDIVKASLSKIGRGCESIASGIATPILLAYLKVEGWMP